MRRNAAVASVLLATAVAVPARAGAQTARPAAVAAAPSPGRTGTTARPAGRLVIVGGGALEGASGEAVYRAILDGRQGKGPFCVIPTATPGFNAARETGRFERYTGPGTVIALPLEFERQGAASDPKVVAQLRGCSGFFFTGGSQSRILRTFRPKGGTTPAFEALLERWRAGAVVSGTSAGAAIMSDPMINGGSSGPAFEKGVAGRGVQITPGLGFFDDGLVDQHFLARGRIGRLAVALLEQDAFDLGFGIDESTALVVDAKMVRVVGASGVVLIDARKAERGAPAAGTLRLHLLGPGDRFDRQTRRVSFDPSKRPLAADGPAVAPPQELFARWAFLHLIAGLSRSPDTQVVVPTEAGARVVVLRKDDGFRALSLGGAGVEGAPAGLSAGPLLLEIQSAAQ